MKNKQKIKFHAVALLVCCTVIFSALACKKTEISQTIIADLSSLSTPMDTGIDEIAKVVGQAISDGLREAEADMGNGTPELELFKVGAKNEKLTYKGTVPFYSGAGSFDRKITVIYDGKTVVYSFDDQPDYVVSIKSTQDNNKQDNAPPKSTPKSAQQYDPESDFNVKRIRVTRNSKDEEEIEITAYVGDNTVVRIPPRIQNLPVTRISENAFPKDITSVTVTIPNGVTSIGDEAFSGCPSLTSVTIPNSVTSIGYRAFGGCSRLASITIPDSVISMGGRAFYNCSSLASITIPKGVTAIGPSAFGNCTSLTSITIPNSVTGIGNRAFDGCTSLTSINLPNSLTIIGERAFAGCTSLTSVSLPNSLTGMEDSTFYGCTSLTSVSLPNSLTRMGRITFSNCTGLTSVTIGNGLTRINSGAFMNCTSLASITIGRRVASIEFESLANCPSLASITIPSDVSIVNAFPYGDSNYGFDNFYSKNNREGGTYLKDSNGNWRKE